MRIMIASKEAELSSGAKIVGLRLSLYMNERTRRAWPSYDQLAFDCGMSQRMVQEHTKKLEAMGWIEVDRVRNKGNTYWLKHPYRKDNGSGVPLITEVEFR